MDRITLSPFFFDGEVVSQLRSYFSSDEMWQIDFNHLLSHAEDNGDFFKLKIGDRLFHIDKITGGVNEVL